jgi:peptidoglycan/xylan/chitin deacetylase (PgdA/CDA1 family)
MIAGAIGNSHYLKASEIRAMSDLVDIQSHTLTHPDLTKLNQGRLNYELAESKKQLEALTNKKVIALAYPSGRYNNLVLDVTRRYYRYAVITVRGSYHYGDNLYLIRRIPIPRSLSLKMFVERLNCER